VVRWHTPSGAWSNHTFGNKSRDGGSYQHHEQDHCGAPSCAPGGDHGHVHRLPAQARPPSRLAGTAINLVVAVPRPRACTSPWQQGAGRPTVRIEALFTRAAHRDRPCRPNAFARRGSVASRRPTRSYAFLPRLKSPERLEEGRGPPLVAYTRTRPLAPAFPDRAYQGRQAVDVPEGPTSSPAKAIERAAVREPQGGRPGVAGVAGRRPPFRDLPLSPRHGGRTPAGIPRCVHSSSSFPERRQPHGCRELAPAGPGSRRRKAAKTAWSRPGYAKLPTNIAGFLTRRCGRIG